MKALILNSGVGHRMGALTQQRPKGMTDIGQGYTILSRQLEQLAAQNISEVVITTGAFAEVLESHVAALSQKPPVTFVYNADYAATNYIVSMHLAAPLLAGEDLLFLHGDLVLEDSVVCDLLAHPHNTMAVDSTLPLPEKDFKAKLKEGRIVTVGVPFFGADCVACQPAYKWLAQDFAVWIQQIDAFVKRGETNVYGENAFNALDGALPLFPLELRGRLCHEIDNPTDLAYVSGRFLDSLAQRGASR